MKIQALICAVTLIFLGGCVAKVDHRGHVNQADMQKKITIGETTKKQVELFFGSPSSQSSFGDETWYYIKSRKEAHAFLKPEIKDQQVIAVVFDQAGIVKELTDYGMDDRAEVVVVSKQTPTEGHSIGFLEQVLGNFGRFNTPSRDVSPTNRPGRR